MLRAMMAASDRGARRVAKFALHACPHACFGISHWARRERNGRRTAAMARPACGNSGNGVWRPLAKRKSRYDEVKQLKILVHDYMMRGRERDN